ncbi:MAG: hypothetical protein V2A73_16155 [Pseudomonadota bacterium]
MGALATVAICAGAFGLLACDTAGNNDPDAGPCLCFSDANIDGPTPDSHIPIALCNPVEQTGCELRQKCTFIFRSPWLGETGCAAVPHGPAQLGDECTAAGSADSFPHVDECDAGLLCSDGLCKEICTTSPDSCPEELACVHLHQIFEEGIGLCNQGCVLHAQDCPDEKACYQLFVDGFPTVCLTPVPEPDTSNDGCVEVEGEEPQGHGECCSYSYINTCQKRMGCVQPNRYDDGNVCAAFCDPTGSFDPPPPTCADFGIAGGEDHCLSIAKFFVDVPDLDLSIGFCIIAEDWGPASCYNDVQDAGEDGVDCCIDGAECPCTFSCG